MEKLSTRENSSPVGSVRSLAKALIDAVGSSNVGNFTIVIQGVNVEVSIAN